MKTRTARRISQVFFFSLFLFFVVISDLRYLKGYPVSLFLELDPLVAFATAITTHTVYKGLLWSLLLIRRPCCSGGSSATGFVPTASCIISPAGCWASAGRRNANASSPTATAASISSNTSSSSP